MLVTLVREGLGRIIVFGEWLTRPRALKRSQDQQLQVASSVKNMALYQFYACPFCIKVRRHVHVLNLPMPLRDAQHNAQDRKDLAEQGGALQVPCLRIEEDGQVRWLYESKAIIAYLHQRFGDVPA